MELNPRDRKKEPFRSADEDTSLLRLYNECTVGGFDWN